jgi:hypothetical protein
MVKGDRSQLKIPGEAAGLEKSAQAVKSPDLKPARCRLLERTPRQNHPLGQPER